MTAWLLLLLRDGPSYGYDLHRELEARRLDVDSATLYRKLRTLEEEGRVQSRWMASTGGPRRRFYRLTPKGRRTLNQSTDGIRVVRDAHDAFLRANERLHDTEREGSSS